ncbi:hypothetical protein CJJ23_02115 [Mycoplasmopsis agassizii]|uniref:Transmembrane protein n=1 Tax=Mycoplasmopsis agassizii TaxID=33922 RepID=A0A269TIW1_9BACT|nr:hypothetical protein [Mycoplasmopsis agassizii]PAK21422.1 hypothetical protein CJJ23_02115 [Mycoplasmopsis agassizii]
MSIWNLGETLQYILFLVFWHLFITVPLAVLYGIEKLLSFVSSIFTKNIVFSSNSTASNIHPSTFFLFFFFISLLMFAVIFVGIYLRTMVNQSQNNFIRMKYALKNSFVFYLLIIAVPFILFFAFYLFSSLLDSINGDIFTGGNKMFSHMFYESLKPPQTSMQDWLKGANDGEFRVPDFDLWRATRWSNLSIVMVGVLSYVVSFFLIKLVVYIMRLQLKISYFAMTSPMMIVWVTNNEPSKINYFKERIISYSIKLFLILVLLKFTSLINSILFAEVDKWTSMLSQRITIKGLLLVAYLMSITKFSEALVKKFKYRNMFKTSSWNLKTKYIEHYKNYYAKEIR